MRRLDLDLETDPLEPTRPLRILALAGGGYRGLFTAEILVHLEKELGHPVGALFELTIGTSAGALLAAGIANRVPAHDIRDAFLTHGSSIFPSSPLAKVRQFLVRSPYATAPLESAISAVLGSSADLKIKTWRTNLAITAVSQTQSEIRLYTSGDYAKISHGDLTVKQAVLASAAAPTYFPPQRPEAETLVDGGITANAPELVGLGLVNAVRGGAVDRARIISIGTAAPGNGRPALAPGPFSFLSWMRPDRNLLLLTLEAQEHLASMIAEQLLGRRYCKVDAKPSAEQTKVMGKLDAVSKEASETLMALAGVAWQRNKTKVLSLLQ